METICKDRPPSHGVEHMKKVHSNAITIWEEMPHDGVFLLDVEIVALLHDVADHKYDKDGELQSKINNFLLDNDVPNPYSYVNTINCISYSKEKRGGKRWFTKVLDPYWLKVRDIVSDADKWEALGEIGGRRCIQYAAEVGEDTQSESLKHLLIHMQDKLLLLKDEYFSTVPGKKMAEKLQDELVQFAISQTLEVLTYLEELEALKEFEEVDAWIKTTPALLEYLEYLKK